MRLLLDTCTFLWIYGDADRLSEKAGEAFADPENEVYLSSVSTWEIAVKHAAGRLLLSEAPSELIPRLRQVYGIRPLPFGDRAALHVAQLPRLHRDPFDRMLVCQAVTYRLTVLTPDELIAQYAVSTMW